MSMGLHPMVQPFAASLKQYAAGDGWTFTTIDGRIIGITRWHKRAARKIRMAAKRRRGWR